MGLIQLVGADILRPKLGWLMSTSSPLRIANEMARVGDPHGLAQLRAVRATSTVGDATVLPAIERIALIMAAKGNMIRDITPGDCLELLKISREVFPGPGRSGRHSPFFYQLLHSIGVFPAEAPSTVRMFSTRFPGQLTVEQLIDRYDLARRSVRDLLVDYLRERQPTVDYNTRTVLRPKTRLWVLSCGFIAADGSGQAACLYSLMSPATAVWRRTEARWVGLLDRGGGSGGRCFNDQW